MLWTVGGMLGTVLLVALTVAWHIQPLSPWWFAGKGTGAIRFDVPDTGSDSAVPSAPATPESWPVIASGKVTDLERYALARAAGFSALDAVTAAAISMAEDGSGDPAALSPANRDGSRDLGLWQINSGWWPQFGGQAALEVPSNNAHAAFVIFGRQGWCAWSVYESKCGPGHNGSYFGNLGRARAAAAAYGQ
ncbi:MAG: hypothetical protein NVS4B6_19190 [Mycobacterium sp.]